MINDPLGFDRQKLFKALNEAHELFQSGQYRKAQGAFKKVAHLAAKLGVVSAAVEWGSAITAEALGEFDRAFAHIKKAIALDPLDRQINHSYGVISNSARDALKFAIERQDAADIEAVYKLLVTVGEADLDSHLLYSRHLLQVSRPEEAVAILNSVTTLWVGSRAAWEMLTHAAVAVGDHALAERAQVQALCHSTGARASA